MINYQILYEGVIFLEKQVTKYIGYNVRITGLEMADTYKQLALADRDAADILFSQKLYNQAVYMYIQSMEKNIKSCICNKINVTLPFYASKLREIGHSLDNSILFLIEILSGNDNGLKSQLNKQLLKGVFEEINFRKLHNNCRYPKYNENSEIYYVLNISEKDCIRIKEIATKLDLFLDDFYKIQ